MDPVSPDPLPSVPWALFDRYFAGEATPEECAMVEAQLARHGTQPDALASVLRAPESYLATPEADGDLVPAWAAMARRLDGVEPRRTPIHPAIRMPASTAMPRSRVRWLSVAGVGALAAAAIVTVAVRRANDHETPVQHRYATSAAQRATVTLPDGSRAVLAPSTTVIVSRTSRATDVTVDGQALLVVSHDARTPFVVHTTHSVTRVLGTTFLVREYATDRSARIVVADGRVAVQAARTSARVAPQAVLVANTLGVVTDSGQVTVTPNVAADDYTGWTTGKLVFRDTPVPQIIAELSRAYGVDIELTDTTLAKQVLTWRVESERNSMSQALHELTTLLGAHVEQTHGVITIVPGRRVSPRPAHSPSASEPQYGR